MTMELSQFAIGREFWFHSSGPPIKMICTDIGTRVVAAIRVDQVEISTSGPRRRTTEVLTEDEAYRAGYLDGPPYMVVENLLDEDDQQVCYATIAEAGEEG